MSASKYQPGVYAKGDVRKTASHSRDAVALVFDGFKLVEENTTAPAAEDAPKPFVSETAEVKDDEPSSTPAPAPSVPARSKKEKQ